MSSDAHDAGGALRRLTLRDRHLAAGARMAPFAGWEMPLQYAGILAEHAAVRTHAGIFDVSHMGRVAVQGPRAGAAIRSITTYDVTRLRPGRAHYSLYCTAVGGVADDVMVYRLAAERWLIVHNAANAGPDAERVRAAAGPDAHDAAPATVMLAVQGPAALGLLRGVLGGLPGGAVGGAAGPGLDAIPPRGCAEVAWQGTTVTVGRTGYTGEDGAECIVDAEHGGALWDACVAAGAVPCGLGARDTLRLEAALPLHGHELTEQTNPFEAGLGWAVSLADGTGFTGRAALAALAAGPPARRLACLQLAERGVPRAGYTVIDGAGGERRTLGTLSSGVFSPTLRAGIGMGYLPADRTAPGTRLAIEIHGRDVPADVVARPFYRRAG